MFGAAQGNQLFGQLVLNLGPQDPATWGLMFVAAGVALIGAEAAGDGVARTSAGRGVAGAGTGSASGAAAAAGLGMTGGADGGRSQATNPQARLRISQRRAAGRA